MSINGMEGGEGEMTRRGFLGGAGAGALVLATTTNAGEVLADTNTPSVNEVMSFIDSLNNKGYNLISTLEKRFTGTNFRVYPKEANDGNSGTKVLEWIPSGGTFGRSQSQQIILRKLSESELRKNNRDSDSPRIEESITPNPEPTPTPVDPNIV